MPTAPATLAGCAALFSGYALFTAYERTAFGELAGGFWIPLLLLSLFATATRRHRSGGRAFDGSAALLARCHRRRWLSDAPLGVMASYLLAAVALTSRCSRQSWAPILRASARRRWEWASPPFTWFPPRGAALGSI